MKLTRRGKIVQWIAIALFGVLVAYLAGHINYTGKGPTGYCWGTLDQCYSEGL